MMVHLGIEIGQRTGSETGWCSSLLRDLTQDCVWVNERKIEGKTILTLFLRYYRDKRFLTIKLYELFFFDFLMYYIYKRIA
jgi:hypothetical protein